VLDNGRLNAMTLERRRADQDLASNGFQQRVKFNRRADFSGNGGHSNHLSLCNSELFATRFNDCVCHG
jgi:hypothetical protein